MPQLLPRGWDLAARTWPVSPETLANSQWFQRHSVPISTASFRIESKTDRVLDARTGGAAIRYAHGIYIGFKVTPRGQVLEPLVQNTPIELVYSIEAAPRIDVDADGYDLGPPNQDDPSWEEIGLPQIITGVDTTGDERIFPIETFTNFGKRSNYDKEGNLDFIRIRMQTKIESVDLYPQGGVDVVSTLYVDERMFRLNKGTVVDFGRTEFELGQFNRPRNGFFLP